MKLESVWDDPAPKSFFALCCLIALWIALKHKEWLSVNKGEMWLKALLALLMLTWVSTIIFTQTNQTQDRKCLLDIS